MRTCVIIFLFTLALGHNLYNYTFSLQQPGELDPYFENATREIFYSKNFDPNLIQQDFSITFNEAEKITKFLKGIHLKFGSRSRFPDPLDCIIIGGGPNGLLSAIQSFLSGCNTNLFEKRVSYTRNIWLDLYPKPWSDSHREMQDLGLQNFEFVPQKIGNSENDVMTVRTMILEQFLFKICRILGIEIKFGETFDQKKSTVGKAVISSIDSNTQSYSYNVLIGADGRKSLVREFAGISVEKQERVILSDTSKIDVKNLSQLAWIVNIERDANGNCPKLKKIRDPWEIGFFVPDVHSCFKRWYFGHCQLQILFHQDAAESIRIAWRNDVVGFFKRKFSKQCGKLDNRYPTMVLFHILELLLKRPPRNMNQVAKMIKLNVKAEMDHYWINTVISRAKAATKITSTQTVVFLSGDSAITPHFRLGIGVNNGFISFHEREIQYPLTRLNEIGKSRLSLSRNDFSDKIHQETNRLEKMVNFQVSTIYYEAYLKEVIFFDGFTQYHHKRDFKTRDYSPIKATRKKSSASSKRAGRN